MGETSSPPRCCARKVSFISGLGEAHERVAEYRPRLVGTLRPIASSRGSADQRHDLQASARIVAPPAVDQELGGVCTFALRQGIAQRPGRLASLRRGALVLPALGRRVPPQRLAGSRKGSTASRKAESSNCRGTALWPPRFLNRVAVLDVWIGTGLSGAPVIRGCSRGLSSPAALLFVFVQALGDRRRHGNCPWLRDSGSRGRHRDQRSGVELAVPVHPPSCGIPWFREAMARALLAADGCGGPSRKPQRVFAADAGSN